MRKRVIFGILAVLLVLTAATAWLYLSGRENIPEGAVKVTWQNKTMYLTAGELGLEKVTGELVNGKGEAVPVDAMGTELSAALAGLGIPAGSVTVTAQDAFSAQVSGEEVREPGKVYLTVSEESVTLVVFGDSNSKRNVRNVASIEVEE